MQAHVSAVGGREIALWSTVFGAPLGTMTYAVRVEGIADLQALSAQILADADYHAKLAKGADYAVGNAEDRLFQPLNAEFGDPPPVGSMALVTSAVIANGAYEKAIAWGLDMAQHASSVTGIPTLFLVEQYGTFGSVGWIGVAADGAAIDAADRSTQRRCRLSEEARRGRRSVPAGVRPPDPQHPRRLTRRKVTRFPPTARREPAPAPAPESRRVSGERRGER